FTDNIEGNCGQEDQAFYYLLYIGTYSHYRHPVIEYSHNQGSKQCAAYSSNSARSARAAYETGCDCIHLKGLACLGRGRIEAGGKDNTGNGSQESHIDINEEKKPVCFDTR